MAVRRHAYSYDTIAFAYDALASIYSFGRIDRSKRAHLSRIHAGDRVLYVGCGRGKEAVAAAALGARVTVVDLSPRMLAAVERHAREAAVEIEIICQDVYHHQPSAPYDMLCAHYFLNLFSPSDNEQMLDRLVDWVRPGGLISLADFAPAEGGAFARAMTSAYYRPVNWIAGVLGYCALHPIPDYPEMLLAREFKIVATERFSVGSASMPGYWSVVGSRAA